MVSEDQIKRTKDELKLLEQMVEALVETMGSTSKTKGRPKGQSTGRGQDRRDTDDEVCERGDA